MSASAFGVSIERQKTVKKMKDELKPFCGEVEMLCNRLKGATSSVTILTGPLGCGKSTYIPAIVSEYLMATKLPVKKTLVAHPSELAISQLVKWMGNQHKELDTAFTKVKMVSSLGKISEPQGSGPKGDLIYAQSKYVAYMMMEDNEFINDCRVIFVDEAQYGSVYNEMIILSIKTIVASRESLDNPVHFVIMCAQSATDSLCMFLGIPAGDIVTIPDEAHTPHSGVEDFFFDESPDRKPRIIDEEVVQKVTEIMRDRQKHDVVPSIVVFAHTHEYITTLMEVVKQSNPDWICHGIFDSSLEWLGAMEAFHDLTFAKPNILFATPQSMVGLSLNRMTDAILIGLKEVMLFDPEVGQDIRRNYYLAQSEVQYLAHRVGRTKRARCHYLFTKKSYNKMVQHRRPLMEVR